MSPPDGAAEIRRIIDRAEAVTPEPPRPLMRELPPADPYPIDALGDVLTPAARAIQDRVQAPLAIGAQSVLGVAALAVQGHADIVLPIGPGLARPMSCYLITIAATGERKSACDTEAMSPIRRREAALRAQYDADALRHANDRAAYDRAREAAMRAGKGNRGAIQAALDELGSAPAPPLTPMLTCEEPTYEGMCRLLAAGQQGSRASASSPPRAANISAGTECPMMRGYALRRVCRRCGTGSLSAGCALATGSRSCQVGACQCTSCCSRRWPISGCAIVCLRNRACCRGC
jgi:Protein of unknown function (DUF3987)